MSTERADALLVAAKCCRMVVGRIKAQDVETVLLEAGASNADPGVSELCRAWGESQLIGMAETLESMAQLDDARWRDVKAKLDHAHRQ